MEQLIGYAATLLLLAYVIANVVMTAAFGGGGALANRIDGDDSPFLERLVFHARNLLFGAIYIGVGYGHAGLSERTRRAIVPLVHVVLVALLGADIAAVGWFWYDAFFLPTFVVFTASAITLWVVLWMASAQCEAHAPPASA